MLAFLALAGIAIGALLGRLYPFVAIALVSPLFWLVNFVALLSDGWSFWQAFLWACGMMFVLQLAYLGGIQLRLRKGAPGERSPELGVAFSAARERQSHRQGALFGLFKRSFRPGPR